MAELANNGELVLTKQYQKSERGTWFVLKYPANEDPYDTLKELGAKRASILSYVRPVDRKLEIMEVASIGPMYFDIDVDPRDEDGDQGLILACSTAINLCKKLVDDLRDFGLNDRQIQVFLSGKKGFHVLIDENVFGLSEPVVNLPSVYKIMAGALSGVKVDMQVYSKGKGNLFRLEGVQRETEDGTAGVMRTYIPTAELADLTPRGYGSLVMANRDNVKWSRDTAGRKEFSDPLRKVFLESLGILKELDKYGKTERNVAYGYDRYSETSLLNNTGLPPCMTRLRDLVCQKAKAENPRTPSYSSTVIQVCIYLTNYIKTDAEAREYLKEFVKNKYSSRFGRDKTAQFEAAWASYRSIRLSARKTFSCGAMRSLVGRYSSNRSLNPMCRKCLVDEKRQEHIAQEAEAVLGTNDSGHLLLSTPQEDTPPQIFIKNATMDVRLVKKVSGEISGYRITLRQTYSEEDSADTIRNATSFELSPVFTSKDLEEAVSRAGFVISRRMYTPENADSIRHAIKSQAADESDKEDTPAILEINKVGAVRYAGSLIWAGLDHSHDSEGYEDVVAVEVESTTLAARMQRSLGSERGGQPANLPINHKRMRAGLKLFLNSRRNSVTSPIVSWMASCWLQPFRVPVPPGESMRIAEIGKHQPTLSIVGTTGTGKSALIEMCVQMCGYRDKASIAASGSTLAGYRNAMASSYSLPAVLEEINRDSGNSGSGVKSIRAQLLEMIKNSWNQDIATVASGGGADAKDRTATTPVAIIGETDTMTESLANRAIRIRLRTTVREMKEEYVSNFRELIMMKGATVVFAPIASLMFKYLNKPDAIDVLEEIDTQARSEVYDYMGKRSVLEPRKEESMVSLLTGQLLFGRTLMYYKVWSEEDALEFKEGTIEYIRQVIDGDASVSDYTDAAKALRDILLKALRELRQANNMPWAFRPSPYADAIVPTELKGDVGGIGWRVDVALAFEMLKRSDTGTNFAAESQSELTRRLVAYSDIKVPMEGADKLTHVTFTENQIKVLLGPITFQAWVDISRKHESLLTAYKAGVTLDYSEPAADKPVNKYYDPRH